jgi:hypothetical protein
MMLSILALAPLARAGVATLNPVADAFVDSLQPDSNFGGGGALQIAAPGSARGQFQAVLRFDTSSAASGFDTAFGHGGWVIFSVTLQLTATPPNNAIFNPQTAGDFSIQWMQNDSWVEGTGMPNTPGSTGVTFSSLPSFLGPADETLGSFTSTAATSGPATYMLTSTPNLAADITSGSLVSLRLFVPGSATAYTFNSRNFGTVANRPVLTITAGARPNCGSADFNGDGDVGTDADIEAFFACIAGVCCPTCDPRGADFNGDGDVGTDADIEAFFRILAGGPC